MSIDEICELLLEVLTNAGYNESTIFNYRGVIRRFKAYCRENSITEYSPDNGQPYSNHNHVGFYRYAAHDLMRLSSAEA